MKAKRYLHERLVPALILFVVNLIWLSIVSGILLVAVFGALSALSSTPFPLETYWQTVAVLTIGGSLIGFLRELE